MPPSLGATFALPPAPIVREFGNGFLVTCKGSLTLQNNILWYIIKFMWIQLHDIFVLNMEGFINKFL